MNEEETTNQTLYKETFDLLLKIFHFRLAKKKNTSKDLSDEMIYGIFVSTKQFVYHTVMLDFEDYIEKRIKIGEVD